MGVGGRENHKGADLSMHMAVCFIVQQKLTQHCKATMHVKLLQLCLTLQHYGL